jgi:hypothetical protein
MDEGNDWVADVRRWYFGRDRAGTGTAAPQRDAGDSAFAAVGYESAYPALQTDWPGAAPEAQ